jgi:hypothetical protein
MTAFSMPRGAVRRLVSEFDMKQAATVRVEEALWATVKRRFNAGDFWSGGPNGDPA